MECSALEYPIKDMWIICGSSPVPHIGHCRDFKGCFSHDDSSVSKRSGVRLLIFLGLLCHVLN